MRDAFINITESYTSDPFDNGRNIDINENKFFVMLFVGKIEST